MPEDLQPDHSRRAPSEPLSPADTAWLRMDTPTNPMVITALLTYAEPLLLADLESFIERRLLSTLRFRRRLVPGTRLRPAKWELDPDLDPRAHVTRVALAKPGGDRELERMVGDVMSGPLDARRPLWEMRLVDGYGGGSALIIRLHHAMADGIALVRLLHTLTGGADLGARPHSAVDHGHQNLFTRGGKAASALGHLLLLPSDPRTSLKGTLGTTKRAAWSRSIPLAALKEIAHRNDAKMNDVFAAVVAGGLRRYLDVRGEIRDDLEVRAVVPVNLRADDDRTLLGNAFGLVFLGLPIGVASPEVRLLEIVRRTRALKESEEAAVTFAILEGMALAPDAIDDLVVDIFEAKATLVLTSVPGPASPVSLGGGRVGSMGFWAPQAGRLGLGVSILSYAGEARIGVVSDANVIAEPREIVEGLEADLDVLSE